MYFEHTTCRACGYAKKGAPGIKSGPPDKLIPVFDLGAMPLANDFVKEGGEHAGYTPLSLNFCPRCSLAQLSVVVKPEILYANYPYVTGNSPMMIAHFEALARDLIAEQEMGSVVEIGSNNGLLLSFLAQMGFATLGIEPAINLAKQAGGRGVPTITDFFCARSANHAVNIGPLPDFILARHVFAHVDNWQEFIANLGILSHPKTIIGIEVPYLPDQITNVSFDQIYAEHLSYVTIKAVKSLLEGSPFHIHRVIKYPVHGGSILIMLRHNESGIGPHASVEEFLSKENITLDIWRTFACEAHAQIHKLGGLVRSLVADGKRVCGYGASAKSTVWVNACGFTRKEVCFITDTTPAKQYTTSPGTNIPVVDDGALLRELPDYAVIFAWNFLDDVLAKENLAREKGVKFIVPVPTIRIT